MKITLFTKRKRKNELENNFESKNMFKPLSLMDE